MLPIEKPAVKGKTFSYGHDAKGQMIKVTAIDGKEVKREFLNARIAWPGGTTVPPTNPEARTNVGVANLGIRKFKRNNPDATHEDIQAYKSGAWAFPPAQMTIQMTAMEEKKRGKNKK